jgi:Mycobacterium membrane protein
MGPTTWRTVMGGLAMAGALGTLGCSRDDGGGGSDRAAPSSTTAPTTTTTTAPTTTTTAAPRVVYEVEGAGTVVVSYTASDDRMLNDEVTLPWSEEQTEDPSRLSMLVALTGSPGDVTCRIRRGTEVLAEETLSGTAGPLLSCDYPPSGLPPVTFP